MKIDRYKLVECACTLARENPNKTVYYVTSKLKSIALYIKCVYAHYLPNNLYIINYSAFMNHTKGKDYLAVIDGLDRWLETMHIKDYTNNEGEE